MEVIKTEIEGLAVIEPDVFKDERGYFFEAFNQYKFRDSVADVQFVQMNESFSTYGVVRGLHFQRECYAQAKLVRCVQGKILDVALDLRVKSPTYGRYFSVELSDENKKSFFIPRGFAHGFSVLSDTATFQYLCDNYYYPNAEGGVNALSNTLGIDWRIPGDKIILSEKDKKWQEFKLK